MRKILFAVCAFLVAAPLMANDLELWYNAPANNWNDALPLGNGRIGAMVYGNPNHEVFQLNEETISKGSPYDNYNSKMRQSLGKIRELIFAGKNKEAEELAKTDMISTKEYGRGAAYQPAGNLHIDFGGKRKCTNLRRSLDIAHALSTVTYNVGGVEYKEEAFTSLVDQLLIIRYSANKKGKVSFKASLSYPSEVATSQNVLDGNTLTLEGTSQDAAPMVPGKVNFLVNARVVNHGGKLVSTGNALQVTNADEVVIYLAMATNFKNYKDISADPKQRIADYMKNVRSYDEAKRLHVAKYQEQFGRVSLSLGENKFANLPTDERLKQFKDTVDNQFVELYFQFGRYLLISCSQPGTQPSNLQGIWNDKLNPAWMCRYTVNINTEMNYWPCDIVNLPETEEPLIKMVGELVEKGSNTAREMYGCRGWVVHHNTDLWRMTGAVDYPYSGGWPMSNAWFCQALWGHYLYNGNIDYLKKVYPYLKSASEFFVDFLVTDPRNGYKVVAPSVSPENKPSGKNANFNGGIAMDNQLVTYLFTATMKAAEILGKDNDFADTLQTLRSQIMPMRIGQYGQMQEWAEDWDNPRDHHRHISHLWGFYPGTLISPYRTPAAFEAVKTTLVQRGDPSTGWSMGWKVCQWARTLDGDHAYKLIKNQLTYVPDTIMKGQGGGTYPNFFDAHPPFQIDGNFGCTAGIAEMMVQSHDGFVNLLPAIPNEWKDGEVKGLRCIGGFVIEEMKWKDHQLVSAKIRSTLGGNLRLHAAAPLKCTGRQLSKAQGDNPNKLFYVYSMKAAYKRDRTTEYVEQPSYNVAERPNLALYDIDTKPGELIEVTANW